MRGVALGLALALIVVACTRGGAPMPSSSRPDKMAQIISLWTQIRDWRREAGLKVEPSAQSIIQMRGMTLTDAKRVCPDGHAVPNACDDVCSLADAICDNAEAICGIADELGPSDHQAQEKCTSAKASCREAKQRCCACSETPPAAAAPEAAP